MTWMLSFSALSSDEFRCSMDKYALRLHRAVEAEDLVRVRSLLEKGTDINQSNEWGATPLHLAVTQEKPDIARLLLDCGADIYARQNDGMTLLDMAAWYGRVETTRLLLEKGAAQSQADLQRAVRKATMDGGYAVILVLQEYGAKIGLIEAIYMCDTKAVHRFLEDGVDIEQINDGDTLLMHTVAATLDHPCHNFLPLLLERGANVNALSADGFTPLMTAAKWGKVSVARQLLDYGADPNIQAPDGQTALSLASLIPEHNGEVIELLRRAGAKG